MTRCMALLLRLQLHDDFEPTSSSALHRVLISILIVVTTVVSIIYVPVLGKGYLYYSRIVLHVESQPSRGEAYEYMESYALGCLYCGTHDDYSVSARLCV